MVNKETIKNMLKKMLWLMIVMLLFLIEKNYGQDYVRDYKYNEEGWEFPGLEEFDIVINSEEEAIENQQKIIRKRYKASKEYEVFEEPLYFYDKEGIKDRNNIKILEYKKKINQIIYHVSYFESYEVKGKVFAYRVGLSDVSVRDCDNCFPISYSGGVFFVYYIDTNGDGKFETRSELLSFLVAPDWVYLLADGSN